MRQFRKLSFFSKIRPQEYNIGKLSGRMNTAYSDLDIADDELSGGQNMISASDTSIKKRGGISLFGPFLGNLPITGGFNFVSLANGTQRQLVCYDTGVNIHTSTSSTPISGITLTQGTLCDGTYYAGKDAFYITNGTDDVAKVANDGTGTQTGIVLNSGTHLKPKYINTLEDRLILANVSGNSNRVYYTDILLDTFTNDTQWFDVPTGPITGMVNYFGNLLIFTARQIYSLTTFSFDATTQANWASNILTLPTDFGAIIENTIKVVNRYVYFLGQNMNGDAAIYICDGYNVSNITDLTIKNTMNGLDIAELPNACAVTDGSFYRLYVTESGKGTNNLGIVYDTVKSKFYVPERRWIEGIVDPSCLWSSENQGIWTVFMGTQGTGQVYKLYSNDGLYDELPEERYVTSPTNYFELETTLNNKAAQSFTMSQYLSSVTVPITQIAILIQKGVGTLSSFLEGNVTVRIETDSSGSPSGTLVSSNATATITASQINTAAGNWANAIFTTPVDLTGSTTYWIVIQQPVSTYTSNYYVGYNTGGTYGVFKTYSGSWATVTGTMDFVVYAESPIDGYADSKNYLVVNGKEFKLIKFQTIFSTSANYSVELGFQSSTSSASFVTYLVSLGSNVLSGKWGDGTSKWGDGLTIWGGQPSRNFTWTDIGALENRSVKLRIRNRNANEQFEFNQVTLELLPRFRNA